MTGSMVLALASTTMVLNSNKNTELPLLKKNKGIADHPARLMVGKTLSTAAAPSHDQQMEIDLSSGDSGKAAAAAEVHCPLIMPKSKREFHSSSIIGGPPDHST